MKHRTLFVSLALGTVLLSGCEKEITVDVPDTPERLVVEGTIEQGLPPFIILTRTQGYFEPTSFESLSNMFVRDAVVTVTSNGQTWTLPSLCSGSLTPEQILAAAALTGLDPVLLSSGNICIYTSLDPTHVGVIGNTYELRIEAEGKVLTSVTTIPNPVPLDSVWFKLAQQRPDDDTLGLAWATLSDPDTMGNSYRWMARRISHRPDGSVEDPTYISPLGSSYNDKYVNGLTFDFNFIRGRQFYSNQTEDGNEETGYYKVGDTIAVKFVSLGKKEYDFYTSYDDNVGSSGDLFGTPVNAKTNINGGLGIWAGWGAYLDTIVCQ
ncbi:MAG TPA: DUF4249 domain-containing protein [Flavobacteriales bacterium]